MSTPRSALYIGGFALSLGLAGCKDLSGTQALPAGTVSPGLVQNATGAAQQAVAAQAQFQYALAAYIPVSGELTDELTANARGPGLLNGVSQAIDYADIQVDARLLDQNTDWASANTFATDNVYNQLQGFRGSARQAIDGLNKYAPTTSVGMRGEMYALEGFAEVMLADLFCSGVPLSTLDFQGDYTYQPGSTTNQVYQHAIALFDTALTLASNSAPIEYLAQVGQGRAYLALGEYAKAGQVVGEVPLTFQFVDSIKTCGSSGDPCTTYGSQQTYAYFMLPQLWSVSDRESGTGLPFISSGDPRTASTRIGTTNAPYNFAEYFPNKYSLSGISAIVLASGLEAQLITAEAQLNAGSASGAFQTLNALRSENPLTAGQLPTLADPGTFEAEVDTLFTERAAWLFVDGHRQGDLRRLARQYRGTQNVAVVTNGYPRGGYPGLGNYGGNIDAPVPASELPNPLFTGCVSRD